MTELDPIAILASLDFTDVDSAERVTGGADTVIWRVRQAGILYALRLFRPEQLQTNPHNLNTHRVRLPPAKRPASPPRQRAQAGSRLRASAASPHLRSRPRP